MREGEYPASYQWGLVCTQEMISGRSPGLKAPIDKPRGLYMRASSVGSLILLSDDSLTSTPLQPGRKARAEIKTNMAASGHVCLCEGLLSIAVTPLFQLNP